MFPYEQNVQMYGIANNLLAENVHLKKTIEILKNRYPREHDQQYLTTVDGRTGLWLCTSKMNGVQVVSFAMEWTVDRAILAENYSGDENILAVEFTRGTGKFQECREVKVSYGDFCKNGRLFSACLAMGINIPLRMSSNRKEDLLKAYIATQIIPGEIIELPGWYRDGVNWKYMREENLPYITATGLNAEEQQMDVPEECEVFPEEIFGRCMPDYTELGIWIVGVISRLQTLLYCENLEVRTFVNIVVPQGLNDSIIEQVECMLLNPEVIRLPIKKRELHSRLKKARDRAVLLVVEDDCKTQRQIDDLTEVLKIIRTDNNSSEYKGLTKIYLPCVISEIPLGNLTGRDTFFVEVKKIPWQKSECNRLTGSKIVKGLVCFVEKHPEELHEIIDCAKRLRTNDERFSEYLGLLQAMEISERILKKFMKMRGLDMKADYRATERLISNSLSLIEDGGVIEAFVEVFRKLYFSQKLLLCTPRTPIPDDMRHNLWAVETDSTVNFEPAVFERILKQMPFLVNSLRLMQLLYTENILEADNSGKRCYKKKTRYTKPNGEVAYDRFVVLRKDKLGIGDEIL